MGSFGFTRSALNVPANRLAWVGLYRGPDFPLTPDIFRILPNSFRGNMRVRLATVLGRIVGYYGFQTFESQLGHYSPSSRTALSPVNDSHRLMATSMYLGSRSMA